MLLEVNHLLVVLPRYQRVSNATPSQNLDAQSCTLPPKTDTIVPTAWPDLTLTPPTNSPEVQEWLKELEGHTIPNYGPNPSVTCGAAENAAAFAAAGEGGRCWWTCGGCLRETDVTQCKDQWDWGHTYDDGPGFYTNKLLTYLNTLPSNGDIPASVAPGVKATFYVVGARVISRPEIVVYEYMNNHEISIHTWSHSALTTLTNEQVSTDQLSSASFLTPFRLSQNSDGHARRSGM